MTTFQEETFAQVQGEIRGLLKEHWEEVALDKESIPLDPDWDQYRAIDGLGMLSILTARDSDGLLVGYYVAFIRKHLHYANSLTAFSDLYFLKPQYRNGRTGLRLFQAHEKAMKARGVQKIYTMHKLHVHSTMGRLLKFLGYRHIENIHSKVLEA